MVIMSSDKEGFRDRTAVEEQKEMGQGEQRAVCVEYSAATYHRLYWIGESNTSKRTAFEDLPTEILELIGDYLSDASPPRPNISCGYSNQRERHYTDSRWAFLCTSKRHRDIMCSTRFGRNASIMYCQRCWQMVVALPEAVRANVRCV